MFRNINFIQQLMLIMVAIIGVCLFYGVGLEIKEIFYKKNPMNLKEFYFKYMTPIIAQLTIVMGLFSIFNFSATISSIVSAKPGSGSWAIWITFGILLIISFEGEYLKEKERFTKANLKKMLWNHKEILIVLIVAGIVRMVMFGDLLTQRWDAGEYYYRLGTACESFDFTWQSVWDNFRLCNHSSIGFAMLYAIGEFWLPRKVLGVLIVNLVMTLIALYMIYEMMQQHWARLNRRQAVIGTVLVSIAPLVMGTCGYVNVDYTLAIVFIYMLYAEYKKHYILLAFWGIVLTQTKETGVFVVAGYYIAHFFGMMANNKGSLLSRINAVLRNRITWSTMIIVVFYARYIYKLRALVAWVQNAGLTAEVTWSNSGINCLGFQIPYIITKIKQFFILNFVWILVIVGLAACILMYREKKKISMENMRGIIGGTVACVLFGCVYVTYEIARYNILTTVTLIIIIYCFSEQIFSHSRLKKYTLTVWITICLLFVGQNFMPIDIVSNCLFRTVDTGSNKMLFTADSDNYYGDYLVNNYQYTWLDRAYDDMLQYVQYDDEILIIIPSEEFAGSHIQGNYGDTYTAYNIFWDKEVKRRVMYQNQNTERINWKTHENVLDIDCDELPEQAVVFFIPYYQLNPKEILEELGEKYYVTEECETDRNGGSIKYYILQKYT